MDFGDYRLGEFYDPSEVTEPVVSRAARAVVSFQGATGFEISPDGYILTNHHVYDSFGRSGTVKLARTRSGHSGRLKVRLILADEAHDVALYKADTVPEKGLPWLPLRLSPARLGETVFVVGHPSAKPQKVSLGTVLARDIVISGRPSVEYSAQTWWGSSGSPVLDTAGRVLAIHWGWDADGLSNGRLTGVPFHVIHRALPRITAHAGRAKPQLARCERPGTWSLVTEAVDYAVGRSRDGGRSLDQLVVKVSAPESCMRALSGVTYHLHPSFQRPTVEGARSAGFPILLGAWGFFKARAELMLKDRSEPLQVAGWVRGD